MDRAFDAARIPAEDRHRLVSSTGVADPGGFSHFDPDGQMVRFAAGLHERHPDQQILEGLHELAHAIRYREVLSAHGGNVEAARAAFFADDRSVEYARDEVAAEQYARSTAEAHLGRPLRPDVLVQSFKYQRRFERRLAKLQRRS
jgi:hypothetical protein